MRQTLGQHFLHDQSVIESILNSFPHNSGDLVVEVGPGKGVLTHALVEKGHHVLAIEWDEQLAAELAKQYEGQSNVQVIPADIRRFHLTRFLEEEHGKEMQYRIISNLPYYLTNFFLRQLFTYSTLPVSMTLLIQKEVAERICAGPGSSERSMLSVLCQSYSVPHIVRMVSRLSFTPPPAVESAVICFEHINRDFFNGISEKRFFQVVKAGFSQKRKTVLNSVSAGLRLERVATLEYLTKAGISSEIRAQDVTNAQWKSLCQVIPE